VLLLCAEGEDGFLRGAFTVRAEDDRWFGAGGEVDDEPVAALVSLKNVDRESLVLSTSPAFLRLMQAAREELARGDSVSLEEIKREPG
jgi:hypothetical protein